MNEQTPKEHEPVENPAPAEQPAPEKAEADYLTQEPDVPITGEEVRGAVNDLWGRFKEAWLIPVRKEVRGVARTGKDFLAGLGDDTDKKKPK